MGAHSTLKALGSLSGGPRNTLARKNDIDSQTISDRPTKKQRRDSSAPYTHSRYFTSNTHDATHDPIQDLSQDDVYEIASNSSLGTGKSHNTVCASVEEFRNIQPKTKVSTRVRRSRRSLSSYPSKVPGSFPDPDADAPDDLSIEDFPLTNVTSDLTRIKGTAKRPRVVDALESSGKRMKPTATNRDSIDISEDELSMHPQEKHNQDHTQETPPRRSDIRTTEFRSAKITESPHREQMRIGIQGAVSGSHVWAVDSDTQAWLVPETRNHVLHAYHVEIDGRKVDLTWLRLELKRFQAISYSDKSQYICITRAMTLGTTPSKLFVKLQGQKQAGYFVSKMKPSLLDKEEDATIPEKKYNHARAQAKSYSSTTRKSEKKGSAGVVQSVSPVTSPKDLMGKPTSGEVSAVSKPMKLVDRLAQSVQDARLKDPKELANGDSSYPVSARTEGGPDTRSTRRSSSKPYILAEIYSRWTTQNPNWRDKWQKSLVYPATGRDRATVDVEDIARLDEGEFLNDNLISFYLRYLQVQLAKDRPEVLEKVYIFSSFFYEQLKSGRKYEGVKGWTARVDLFSYDYIVVPVNENAHWYLAIICNAPRALPGTIPQEKPDIDDNRDEELMDVGKSSPVRKGIQAISLEDVAKSCESPKTSGEKVSESPSKPSPTKMKNKKASGSVGLKRHNPMDPKIITLDSLGNAHSPTCRTLREYLISEAMDKKSVELAVLPSGVTGKGIPEQDNYCDCGVFVLGYMEEFLKDPDEAARRLLQKESTDWAINPSQLRGKIRELLFGLQQEQHERLTKEREEKKKAAFARKQASQVSSLTNPTSPAPAKGSSSGRSPSKDEKRTPPAAAPNLPPSQKESSSERSQPHTASSPVKHQKDDTTGVKLSPGPKLISPLGTSSSDQSDGTSRDVFFSACTSPMKCDPNDSTPKRSPKGRAAAKESNSVTKALIREQKDDSDICPSIEISDDDQDIKQSLREKKQSKHLPTVSSFFKPRPPSSTGYKYDGIDLDGEV